jgi:hypothetical protein
MLWIDYGTVGEWRTRLDVTESCGFPLACAMYEAVARKYPALAKYPGARCNGAGGFAAEVEVVTFAYTSEYLVRYHDLAIRRL